MLQTAKNILDTCYIRSFSNIAFCETPLSLATEIPHNSFYLRRLYCNICNLFKISHKWEYKWEYIFISLSCTRRSCNYNV